MAQHKETFFIIKPFLFDLFIVGALFYFFSVSLEAVFPGVISAILPLHFFLPFLFLLFLFFTTAPYHSSSFPFSEWLCVSFWAICAAGVAAFFTPLSFPYSFLAGALGAGVIILCFAMIKDGGNYNE